MSVAEQTTLPLTVTVETRGHERRTRYQRREDGRIDAVEETKTNDGSWRTVGHDVLDDLTVSGA